MHTPTTDVAFTAAVKALQSRRGSRAAYARLEERGGWSATITEDLAAFIADRDSFYLATANAAGQPYIQHRGGPRGFLRVLDDRTLGFADFRGNRQYITAGNLAENDRAFIFLMDYENRQRIKMWGRARVVDDDTALLARLAPRATARSPSRRSCSRSRRGTRTARSTSRNSCPPTTSRARWQRCRRASRRWKRNSQRQGRRESVRV